MADAQLADQLARDPYVPPAFTPPATVGDRIVSLLTELRQTPGRAAVATLSAALFVIGLFALRPATVTGTDEFGAFRARCGVTLYVTGHNSARVQQMCRDAYAGRAAVLLACVVGALACAVALVVLLHRPARDVPAGSVGDARLWRRLSATPGRAALLTADAVLLLVVLFSLVPVRVHGHAAGRAYSAQCGIGFFVSAQDDAVVDRACRDAYGGHAVVLFGGAVALAAGVVALGMSARSGRQE